LKNFSHRQVEENHDFEHWKIGASKAQVSRIQCEYRETDSSGEGNLLVLIRRTPTKQIGGRAP
jgi:hypothetical protein